MKIDLHDYTHGANGMSLQIFPETDVEANILKAFFAHGEMKTGHPCGARGGMGFYIQWKPDKDRR